MIFYRLSIDLDEDCDKICLAKKHFTAADVAINMHPPKHKRISASAQILHDIRFYFDITLNINFMLKYTKQRHSFFSNLLRSNYA